MISNRPPRKPDLLIVMLMMVAIGMTGTLAYQINLYFNDDGISLTRQAQNVPPTPGG